MSEQNAIPHGSRAIIAAKYLPLLGEFRGPPDDIRYYLHGIYIEPHEDDGAGAYLCATDGHRLVVIHDESAEVDGPMLVNPEKLLIQQAKRATLADFDGTICDLQDEEEKFLVTVPAPLIDAKFIEWRQLIPTEDVVCEPGAIDPLLMAAIAKAPFGEGSRDACIYTRQDKPCIVRFPSLPEIFVLIMPTRSPAMRSSPEWAPRKRKREQAQQAGLDLASAGEAAA